MTTIRSIVSHFRNKKILVIGDVILDQHIRGGVSRISPEAPVPIVLQDGLPQYAPGGSANVAYNLRSLGAGVTLLGRIGRDPEGRILLEALRKKKISTRAVFVDPVVPTILKTRIIAQHQQMLRIDREVVDQPVGEKIRRRILDYLHHGLDNFDAVIISDYGKGMISRELVATVCSVALKKKKVVTVDPKVEHFGYYRKVTAITPNKVETENAIRNIKITHAAGDRLGLRSDRVRTLDEVRQAGRELLKFLDLESLLVTLGEQGMMLFERGREPLHIPTKAKEVFDVTGAGDTVIAVFTLALTAHATKVQAADLANHAAGIVVGKMGAATVTKEELLSSNQ